jgi:hypothetical protein
MRRSFEHIVTSMRGLLSQFIDACMTHPLNVLGGVAAVLSVLFTYIFCVEFAKVREIKSCYVSTTLCLHTLSGDEDVYYAPPLPAQFGEACQERGSHCSKQLAALSGGGGSQGCSCGRRARAAGPLPGQRAVCAGVVRYLLSMCQSSQSPHAPAQCTHCGASWNGAAPIYNA